MGPEDLTAKISEIANSYQYNEPPAAISASQELLSQLSRLIIDFLDSLSIHLPFASNEKSMSQLLMIVLAVLTFLCLLIAFSKLVRRWETKVAESIKPDIFYEPILTGADWLKTAHELADAGQIAPACRALLISTLHELDQKSLITYTPVKTNFEYLCQLKQNAIYRPFMQLANKVDFVWFGKHPGQRQDFEDCLNLYKNISKSLNTTRAEGGVE